MSTSDDPLWALVAMAFDPAPNAREGAAAVLRVIADEIFPEEDEPPCGNTELLHRVYERMQDAMREQRQLSRQRLLAEAERAEAGR